MGENRKTAAPPKRRKPKAQRAKRAPADVPEAPPGLLARLARYKRPASYAALAMGTVLAIAFLGLLVFFGRARGPDASSQVVELDWPAGLGPEDAAELLGAAGLTASPETLALFFRATGGTDEFAAGPHLLPTGATAWELRKLLGRSALRAGAKLTVPEGFNRFDIGARLEKLRIAGKKAFVAASADPKLLGPLGLEGAESAEGYLFPATYDLAVDSDPREIVKTLVAASDKRWAALAEKKKAGFERLKSALGWGRRDVLTLASIIEKEAVVDDERPVIASVFFNRLTDPAFTSHRLQSDPTSNYGCVAYPAEAPSCKSYAGKATPATLHDAKNRYSTYAHPGLPPGPIANPGAKSIEAVLSPAATHFLYFVAAGRGRHTFSETFGAHNDAVRGRTP